ncbi:MAG: hypothetical protein K2X41_13230 [Hyphomicrobium sp.]|nr:hypothetical protein [Hyphomicrobium sp.]
MNETLQRLPAGSAKAESEGAKKKSISAPSLHLNAQTRRASFLAGAFCVFNDAKVDLRISAADLDLI